MGKRGSVEKPSSTNITPPDRNTADSNKEIHLDEPDGPYTLTNNFVVDFHELARRAGFPKLRVVAQPERPKSKKISSAGLDNTQQSSKTDKDKKEDLKTDRTVSQSTNRSETGHIPTTFLLKEKYEYFRPCLRATWESHDGKPMLKEIYIRGWRIDSRIMEILSLTLPTQDNWLTKIDFTDAGLTDDLLNILANTMKYLPAMRYLGLDGNPVHQQRYSTFLTEDSSIQNISLRNCYVNDQGATDIARALTTNKHLQNLNLCFNKISCEGVTAIAKALRTNRTLLSLDLGCNNIEDVGASQLAEVISRFPMNHEETVARRLLLSKKTNDEVMIMKVKNTNNVITTRSSFHEDHQTLRRKKTLSNNKVTNMIVSSSAVRSSTHSRGERPPSVRSGSTLSKEQKREKGKTGGKKEKRIPIVEDKLPKKASATDTSKDVKKGKKSSMAKVDKKGFGGTVEQDINDTVDIPNPLLEPVEEVQGTLYIPGNRALVRLNLSGNKIGEIGMKSLLTAIQYQNQLLPNHTSRHLVYGLLRLSLKRNAVAQDNCVFQSLQDLMITRDPFYKPDNLSHDGSLKEIE